MPTSSISTVKPAVVLAPVADALAGTVGTTPVNIGKYEALEFVLIKGVGATGTSTITVEACTSSGAANPEAIPFSYRVSLDKGNTWGEQILATAAGFATTAGSDHVIMIQVPSHGPLASLPTKKWVRLKAVEVVDSPVLATVIALLHGCNYNTYETPWVS